jgi:hypothetical protein
MITPSAQQTETISALIIWYQHSIIRDDFILAELLNIRDILMFHKYPALNKEQVALLNELYRTWKAI